MADKAHDLVAALRFHKHPLTQQAADRIVELEADLADTLRAVMHHFGPDGAHKVTTTTLDLKSKRSS